jgi:dipeptidase E
MKFLLTAGGITNRSIRAALVELLGKPIAESTALVIPTAAYYFREGPSIAYRLISGKRRGRCVSWAGSRSGCWSSPL